MKIAWTETAAQQLEDIKRYVGADNPEAAKKIAKRVANTVELLAQHPALGERTHMVDVRKKLVPQTPYGIYYQFATHHLTILRVLHGARLHQPGLWP